MARIDSLVAFALITVIPNIIRRSLEIKLQPLSTISVLEFLLVPPPPLSSSAPSLPSSERLNHLIICALGRTLFPKLFTTFYMFR